GAALLGAIRHQRQLRQEAEETAIVHDRSARNLQIIAGFTNLQSQEAQTKVGEIATRTGVSQPIVNRIAQQFLSEEFKAPLESGAVDAFVATLQAGATDPNQADVEGIVGGFAK